MTDGTAEVDFLALVQQCRPSLVRTLARLVGDANAEDVTQITLAKAASALGSFRGEASPKSWLFRIGTNAAHDWNRSRLGSEGQPLPEEPEDDTSQSLATDAGQERHLVRQQMSQCVREVLRRLPEGYQTALALSDCEELSDRELAAALGITVGAAKIRLHRARARLKEALERECSFYRDADNVLCCDQKQQATEEKETTFGAYPLPDGPRHQVDSREDSGAKQNLRQETIMATETIPSKQKNLIGVGAAIASGCQPCTTSFVAGAREMGACERGVRLSIEVGLRVREASTAAMASFADQTFAKPEVDGAFRAERAQLQALIEVAAAIAGNAGYLVKPRVQAARELKATDEQIRLAAQIGRTARHGAEEGSERALAEALGDAAQQEACCASSPGEEPKGCCSQASADDAAGACACSRGT